MSDDTPRVSVVLPVHDASGYLDRTRRQLAELDASIAYEFVVIDDHSTDDSFDIVCGWAEALPGELVLLRADERGVARARNQALRFCTGDYVWFTDADDEWSPTIVRELVETAMAHGAQVTVCNAVKRTPAGDDVGRIEDARVSETSDGREAFRRLLDGSLQGHLWNKLFARTALPADPFPHTRAHSDLGGMLRVLPTIPTVAYLPRELYVYFQNSGSILNSRDYHFDDLASCLALARAQVAPDDAPLRRALLLFTYRNVVIPTLNELARRRDALDRDAVRRIRTDVGSWIRWSELPNLRAAGASWTLVAQCALARLSTRVYVAVYARTRRGRDLATSTRA